MSGVFFPLMRVFARLRANRVVGRVAVGVALVAVIVAVLGIVVGFSASGHAAPVADGMAWGF